ncbi:hypothetical protein N5S93_08875 [Aliarcobacter cryaerophilus]|uniref:hypothetical protein n=1 Tax=Aliarcobacter cryaerophilus TaxID=28198 RepID=UPI0021B23E25|nr:hypothetical protein [Aliarcobacter cryaerophilus]MCT7495729.1 hypothetical protein [Aliarcobacter cryaerophilus]
MKIELSKDIQIYQMGFVGEVYFFDEKSPYIELLKNIETKDELIDKLKYKNMPDAAIKNIVTKLEGLKVLKNGYLENIEKGFPEKEYGKYTLEIFKNDTPLPFKNKNKEIRREKAVLGYGEDNNIKSDEDYIKIVQDKTNKDFRINTIENNKVNLQALEDSRLVIKYIDQKWHYLLENKSFKMEDINFKSLFEDWDEEHNALMMNFSNIKEYDKYIKSFKISFSKDIELDNYGKLKGRFQDVDIMPKTEYDAKEWFIYILKDEIEQLNRYISKSELNELWENIKEKYSIFKRFDLEFDFELILKEFGRSSKYYWLLQTGIDLYPFDTNIVPTERVIMESIEDYKSKFKIDIKELTVMDRYLNSKRNLSIFGNILNNLNNPSVTIFTTKDYSKNESDEIKNIIDKHNIKRIIKEKNEIEHTRHWIINNSLIYRTGESLDGIHNTSFDLYEKKTIEKIAPGVIKLLEEINND